MTNQQIAREIYVAIGGKAKFQGSVGVIKRVLDKYTPDTAAECERLREVNGKLLLACKCALADLEGIMPEFEPSGDRLHPGWLTIEELRAANANEAVTDGPDDYETNLRHVRECH